MREYIQSTLELELVLIRHGITKWNTERRYLGHTDLPLLPGEREKLSLLGNQPELAEGFRAVLCSDLLRCRETLACLAPSMGAATAIYDSRLREMNFGDWEGCTYEELKDNADYRSWLDDPAAVTPPGGESWPQFEARLRSFMDSLLELQAEESSPANQRLPNAADTSGDTLPEPSRRVLIVTHGGVIRQLLAFAVPGVTFRNAAAPSPGTVTVLRMLWRNGHWHGELPAL